MIRTATRRSRRLRAARRRPSPECSTRPPRCTRDRVRGVPDSSVASSARRSRSLVAGSTGGETRARRPCLQLRFEAIASPEAALTASRGPRTDEAEGRRAEGRRAEGRGAEGLEARRRVFLVAAPTRPRRRLRDGGLRARREQLSALRSASRAPSMSPARFRRTASSFDAWHSARSARRPRAMDAATEPAAASRSARSPRGSELMRTSASSSSSPIASRGRVISAASSSASCSAIVASSPTGVGASAAMDSSASGSPAFGGVRVGTAELARSASSVRDRAGTAAGRGRGAGRRARGTRREKASSRRAPAVTRRSRARAEVVRADAIFEKASLAARAVLSSRRTVAVAFLSARSRGIAARALSRGRARRACAQTPTRCESRARDRRRGAEGRIVPSARDRHVFRRRVQGRAEAPPPPRRLPRPDAALADLWARAPRRRPIARTRRR